ncbi:MAG: hypothetical protein WAW16_02550 [Candidatus Cryosericum sp.]
MKSLDDSLVVLGDPANRDGQEVDVADAAGEVVKGKRTIERQGIDAFRKGRVQSIHVGAEEGAQLVGDPCVRQCVIACLDQPDLVVHGRRVAHGCAGVMAAWLRLER